MDEIINATLKGLFTDRQNSLSELESDFSHQNLTCPSTDMPNSRIVMMMLYAVVCVIGLIGNSLVIYVVIRFSNMQTVTNMYILNLAIADECFLIGIPFLITTMHLGHWTFGKTMCKAYMVSTSITQFTSSIFLLIMSADRYIAICRYVSAGKYRTQTVSIVVSIIAWAASVVVMLPIMLYSDTILNPFGSYTCSIIWPEDFEFFMPGTSFTFYSLLVGFVIPLCFIMTFYCLVIRKLRSVGKKTNKGKSKRKSHRKATKLVLTVITVYILCWLPYWISQVALISSDPEKCGTKFAITIFLITGCLGYCNSAFNPILYAYLSDNFKKCFYKACSCSVTNDVNAQLKLETSILPTKKHKKLNKNLARNIINEPTQGITTTITTTAATTAASTTNLSKVSSLPADENISQNNPNNTEDELVKLS